jgi:serpin B
MKTFFLNLIACSLMAIFLSCVDNGREILSNDNPNNDPGTKIGEGNYLKSIVARDTSSAPELDIGMVVEGNNAFAWSIFNKFIEKKSNLVFSPYSISNALFMTLVGARGETQSEMTQALMLPFIGERFHATMNTLDQQLKSRGQNATGREGSGFSLKVNNSLWGERTMKFSLPFLDTLSRYYDAGIGLCDFVHHPDSVRLTINSWVSEKTEKKIQDILGPGTIDNLTCLVITNTIYFDAAWADTFLPALTQQRSFYPTESDSMKAWFMEREGTYNYVEDENFQAIEIPYSGNQVSMIMLLPKNKQFLPSEANINNTIVKTLLKGLTTKKIYVRIPKFSFTNGTMSMKPKLITMGMRSAFTNQADFSGITPNSQLFIDDVFHEASIVVNEKGTTAAAGTVVVINKGTPDGAFFADHPFVFFVRDNPTGQVLFIGYVSEPTKAD